MRSLGFTGTRRGMTQAQKKFVHGIIVASSCSSGHHGDCIGSDADFHDMLEEMALSFTIFIHPSNENTYRAFKGSGEGEFDTVILPPKPPLVRNRDIVIASDLMLATPAGPEILRSGTWSTIRFARQMLRPIVIVMPDGSTL